ncbi:copper amine oxidase [Actinoplanes awajinensis]|uniref:copper amine oxidase n=1 Tax=Actinoplanes awajinensis TaxID=135946 RepID=UPI000A81082B|nr:primary-amine oxidase [Actinoplanes awajinensis]
MRYRKIAGAAALLTAATLSVTAPVAAQAAPAATPCGASAMVKETLPNGTTWQLCWRINDKAGLVLDHVFVATKRYPEQVQVLDSIRLAQLNVPYDTGDTEYNDLTAIGLGSYGLETITGDDCKGGSVRQGSDGGGDPQVRDVLCVSAEPRGLAYRLHEYEWDDTTEEQTEKVYSQEGHDLVLRTISKLGWYEYVTEYRLHDDGQISARLGATGDLAPSEYSTADNGWPLGKEAKDYSTMHYHNAFWRVDFNIAGKGGEKVEQFDTTTSGRGSMAAALTTTHKTLGTEGTFTKANQRFWRLVSPTSKNADGHQRSYELALGASDKYEGHPETKPDVTFSQKNLCEKWASDNAADPECPLDIKTVVDFVKDKEKLADPVMWVRVGFHHVPRDEDQSPMPMHWQGFDLVPRDFTEMNPLTPAGREGANGNTSDDGSQG